MTQRWRKFYMRKVLDKKLFHLLDFLLPRICSHCNSKLSLEEECLCSRCFDELEFARQKYIQEEFDKKFSQFNYVNDFYSLFLFQKESPIQSVLHSYKYQNRFLIGNFIGRILSAYAEEKIESWEIDFIIPIPLHKVKKFERGFNQAQKIAATISNELNIPISKKTLNRNKFTKTQTKLKKHERIENLQSAFNVKNSKLIADKNILLIDDVITTGSTINECAKVLKEKRANKIFALSVAIAN